jgi:hypothetical protein
MFLCFLCLSVKLVLHYRSFPNDRIINKEKIHTEPTVTEYAMRDSNYCLAGSLLD